MDRRPNQPYYDLTTVRRLALEKKVSRKQRSDGKTDLAKLRISENEFLSILVSLSLVDFRHTDEEHGKRPADVYVKPFIRHGSRVAINIYIKLAVIDNDELLIVISFHK